MGKMSMTSITSLILKECKKNRFFYLIQNQIIKKESVNQEDL